MAKVGFLVALLAAAASAWLGVEVCSLKSELKVQQDLVAELSGRTPAERAAVPGSEPTAIVRGAEGRPGDVATEDAAGGPTLASRPADPAALATRLEDLEKRFAEQEKAVAAVQNTSPGGWAPRGFTGRGARFIHDAASAARELKLDDRQKTEVERIIEGTRRELDDLRTLANDEGMTWKEASKIKFEGSADGGAMIAFGTNMQKLEAFKKSKIPGSNETFGDADRRIRGQAKDQMRRLLSPEQAKTFDDSHTDAMFGGVGNFSTISIATEGLTGGEDK